MQLFSKLYLHFQRYFFKFNELNYKSFFGKHFLNSSINRKYLHDKSYLLLWCNYVNKNSSNFQDGEKNHCHKKSLSTQKIVHLIVAINLVSFVHSFINQQFSRWYIYRFNGNKRHFSFG